MKTKTLKNENIVHVVEEYDIPRYKVRVKDEAGRIVGCKSLARI